MTIISNTRQNINADLLDWKGKLLPDAEYWEEKSYKIAINLSPYSSTPIRLMELQHQIY